MKKLITPIVAILFLACNNGGDSSSSEDTTASNISAVENVNGNIPDTTNALTVEGSSQTNDTKVDSTKN